MAAQGRPRGVPRRGVIGDTGLNLMPVLNVVAILIPLMLMSSQVVRYAAVGARPPRLAGAGLAPGIPLRVRMGREGFVIEGAGPPVGVPCRGSCLPDGSGVDPYDHAALTVALGAVKDRWPDQVELVLAPAPWVPYDAIVRAMDAVRADEVTDPGAQRELFPEVVLAAGRDP